MSHFEAKERKQLNYIKLFIRNSNLDYWWMKQKSSYDKLNITKRNKIIRWSLKDASSYDYYEWTVKIWALQLAFLINARLKGYKTQAFFSFQI